MAAPSRSINYRSGAPVDIDKDSYMALLRSMKNLPKEMNQELRKEARQIAETIVKPAVISEILSHSGPVGPKLAQSVRVRGDRIPSVIIGKSKGPFYSGDLGRKRKREGTYGTETREQVMRKIGNQASTNMLRYGTVVGVYRRATGSGDPSGRFTSRGQEVSWPKNIVTPGWPTAASNKFYEPTFAAWESTIAQVVYGFNSGRI